MHHADSYFTVKRFAGTAVIQGDLGFGVVKAQFLYFGVIAWIGQIKEGFDFSLMRTVKYGRGKSSTVTQILRQYQDFFITQLLEGYICRD